MSDAISALEARLASLETNGFKLNPATANPGKLGPLRQRCERNVSRRWSPPGFAPWALANTLW